MVVDIERTRSNVLFLLGVTETLYSLEVAAVAVCIRMANRFILECLGSGIRGCAFAGGSVTGVVL